MKELGPVSCPTCGAPSGEDCGGQYCELAVDADMTDAELKAEMERIAGAIIASRAEDDWYHYDANFPRELQIDGWINLELLAKNLRAKKPIPIP